MKKNHKSIQNLPDTPGVYFFLGSKREILYVGKATSLKSRVQSYFSRTLVETRGAQIVKMVERAYRVEYRKTDSVLEALILEAKRIKECKPTYNTRDKDDKSFNYLIITVNEEYPRFLTVRGKDLESQFNLLRTLTPQSKKEPLIYGPFPHAKQFKEALKILRKIFPYYDTNHPVLELRKKNDRKLLFNESIGVYPHTDISKQEYARTVRYMKTIFDGKMKTLLRTLERDMNRFARHEKFEQASVIKQQLFSLKHIQDVSLIKRERNMGDEKLYRIEAYDVAHLSGSDTVAVMVVIEKGVPEKKEYRMFTIRNATKGSDTGALKEVLERRLAHPEWQYPRLIVVDGSKAHIRTAQKVLDSVGVSIPVVAVTKDSRHKPIKLQGAVTVTKKYQKDILLANAEAHRFALGFHKKKRAKRMFV
jgi:excinuclease ABC subunit C